MVAEQGQLRRSLGVAGGWAVAASSTAATTSIGIGMGALASIVGVRLPIVLILGFLPILGIAVAYSRLNRVEQNCGNGYVWVGKSLGPWLGFLAGWVLLAGVMIFLAYTTSIVGSIVLQFANKAGAVELLGVPLDPTATAVSTVVGFLVLGLVTWAAVTGIARAARLQTALLAFEYATLIGFCMWGVVAGTQDFSWSWLNPFGFDSVGVLGQGLVIAVFFYWGWDAAFSVTEETRTVESSSRSGYLTLFSALGLFVLGAIAFERVLTPEELAAHPVDALAFFASRIAGEPLASIPLLALVFSTVASLMSGLIPTVRQGLAMGRDRTLGKAWTRISPRWGTPLVGTLMCAGVAVLIALASIGVPRLSVMVLAAVNSIGVLVAFYYGLTAFACAVRFRGLLRTAPAESIRVVIVPAVSGAVMFGIGALLVWSYLTRSDHFEVSPDNGYFLLLVPVLIVVAGLVAAAYAKYVRKSEYFVHGVGTDADAIRLPVDVS